ncbi:MAG: phosphoribosylformylglycinamidine cyclo-ligase [Ignavibacteriaceae bacterium]
MEQTYKAAGVDIKAGEETVKKIKGFAKSTFNQNVLSDLGLFGGFFELQKDAYAEPVLVSSVDGVGTKLKVAIAMNFHATIGQDLVNHCVNDIAVCGAKPLFFLDYLAFGKLNPEIASSIVEGFSTACKQNGCALIGGETAEMPGVYQENDYDMSGTIVGVVEKKEIINGKNICKDDVLIGFQSNGLHTNGYSLARKVLAQFPFDKKFDDLALPLGNELLRVHKSYLNLISHLKNEAEIHGFSHITGGGIVGNTKRIIPENLSLKIDWNAWEVPNLFKLIQKSGSISDEEMRAAFNIGIGLIAVVAKDQVDKVINTAKTLGEKAILLGEII